MKYEFNKEFIVNLFVTLKLSNFFQYFMHYKCYKPNEMRYSVIFSKENKLFNIKLKGQTGRTGNVGPTGAEGPTGPTGKKKLKKNS